MLLRRALDRHEVDFSDLGGINATEIPVGLAEVQNLLGAVQWIRVLPPCRKTDGSAIASKSEADRPTPTPPFSIFGVL